MEPNRITLTEGEQHWRKQVVTFFGCLLNLILAGAGLRLAVTLGTHTAESKMMVGPLMWTAIQVYVQSARATRCYPSTCKLRVGMDGPWQVKATQTDLLACSALAILTAALDAVKNYREGQDLLD